MILKELRKGETGLGYLIERDGYIDINDTKNKTLIEDINKNDGWIIPHPLIVSAVFQKADTPNANGRIYPRHILEREVEKYMQKILERRAYGQCYTPDTLILTEVGWKTLEDVNEGENILTLNPHTEEIEINPIITKIDYDYDGDMIRINGRSINDLVTPDHNYPLWDRYGKYKGKYSAQDIYNNNINDLQHSKFLKTGIWNKESDEYFIIPKLEIFKKNVTKEFKMKMSDHLVLPIKPFMAFMGIYLSEGCSRTRSKNQRGYDIHIYQKNEDNVVQIEEMLIEFGLPFSRNNKKNGCVVFTIIDARLHTYLSKLGNCYEKYVPFEIKNQSKELLAIFYDWFVLGDGRKRGYSDDVFSTSKQLILDLNEIQLKIGFSGSFKEEGRKKDRYITDENGMKRLIKGENSNNMFFTYKSLNKFISCKGIKTSIEKYKGRVMCVEVKNNTWFCMSNGLTHWTNNCDHPADTVIAAKELSHNITKLWWEGKTVVGTLELILSPGYIKQGIVSTVGDNVANSIFFNKLKLGVSSRGVGSVENKNGTAIVQDDFELLCWDIVSDPSTPNAYMDLKPENLKPYIENTQINDKNKLYIIEKIDSLLNKNMLFT
jgi:hypothetical protein